MTQTIPSHLPASQPTRAVQKLEQAEAHAWCHFRARISSCGSLFKGRDASTLRLRSAQASAQHDNAESIRPTLMKRKTGGSVGVAGVFAVLGLFLQRDLIPQALIAQNA